MPVLQALVGTSISVQAIKVDLLGNDRKPTDHIVLSERAYLSASGLPSKSPSLLKRKRAERRALRSALIPNLQVGQICRGVVVKTVDFGAFVEFDGGANGLVHINELSWRHVERVEDVLQIGDEIQVYILTLDREDNRIGLSLRRADTTTPSPDGNCAPFP
jgi:ribosomal protein S1